jgi:hypothetical protein
MHLNQAYILRAYLFDGTLVAEKRFHSLPIRIGRNDLNDFKVPQTRVSSFHAVLEPLNHQLCVRDLSSMNGVYVRDANSGASQRIAPNVPVNLALHGNEFYVGPQVQVSLQAVMLDEPLSSRDGMPGDGAVLGNAEMLAAPGFQAVAPRQLAEAPAVAPPRPTSAPPPPAAGMAGPQSPDLAHPWGRYGAPPSVGPYAADARPAGATPRAREGGQETAFFSNYALEALALQGLHERDQTGTEDEKGAPSLYRSLA